MRKTLYLALALVALAASLLAQWIPLNPVTGVREQPNGVQLTMQSGAMRIEAVTDSIVHIVYSPTASLPKQTEYVVTKTPGPAPPLQIESDGAIEGHRHAQRRTHLLQRPVRQETGD